LERSGREQHDRIPETLQGEMTDGCWRSRYETAVLALRAQVAAMQGDDASSETIARAVHAERRRLTAAFKETAVLALRVQVAAMQGDDASSETIARAVHAERRRLTAAFKELTPGPWRSRIRTRTLAAYGDPVGPTIENLRARGKSWDDIIDNATRPDSRPSFAGSINST
jgi:hypothetical protein